MESGLIRCCHIIGRKKVRKTAENFVDGGRCPGRDSKFYVKVKISAWYACANREARRTYSSNLFTMSTLDECELSTLGPGRFNPYKDPVTVVQEVGLASGPIWMSTKNFNPTGIWSPDRPSLIKSLYRLRPQGLLTLRRQMSYIYGAPILDVSRSHTTTQHSR